MGAYLSLAWAVARKDLLLEARTRERLVAMATFAVLVAVVFSYALDPTVRAQGIAGAMLWVTVLFAAILGLGRAFAMEQETDALTGLVVAPVPRGALYLGKFLANLLLVVAVELVIFPAYALFFQLRYGPALGGLALTVLLATVGIIALGTLFGAVAAHTRLGETALPILLLPLVIPVVIFAATSTQRLLAGRPFAEVEGSLRMLLAFDIVFLVVCTALFGAVLEE
jgi:heme exporter protein B